MQCPECSASLPDGSRFCLRCGRDLALGSGHASADLTGRETGPLEETGDEQTPSARPSGLADQPGWEGRQLGPYRILRLLGRGANAVVHLAEEVTSARRVAVKIHVPRGDELAGIHRFHREAWTGVRLSHPNIVQVLDMGLAEGVNYIVMEFVDGPNLREFLHDAEDRLRMRVAVAVARDCLLALREAHSQGILHRDVKPVNILLSHGPRAKLLDFGLAKPVDRSWDITVRDMIMGTPMFMSPEQVLCEDLDWRTDLFSLGATLYFVLAGAMPYSGESHEAVRSARCSRTPPPVHHVNPRIPEPLSDFVAKLMRIERARRYRNCDESLVALRTALRKIAEHAPKPAAPPESAEPADPKRVVICPRCFVGFTSSQQPSYRCPRPQCGHTWKWLTGTSEFAMTAEGREGRPELMLLTGRQVGGIHRLRAEETTLGMGADCDICLPDPALKPAHVKLSRRGEEVVAAPATARCAFFVNGEPVREEHALRSGDRLLIGRFLIEFRIYFPPTGVAPDVRRRLARKGRRALAMLRDGHRIQEFAMDRRILSLGRLADRDVVLLSESVSRKHALAQREEDGVYLMDTRSRTGTFVNDEPILYRKLTDGDLVQIGVFVLAFKGDRFLQVSAVETPPAQALPPQ